MLFFRKILRTYKMNDPMVDVYSTLVANIFKELVT